MEFFTVVRWVDGLHAHNDVRTSAHNSWNDKVHSFSEYPDAKRYRTRLVHENPGKKFRIVHTVIDNTGDVFSEIIAVAEEDLQ